MSTLLEIKRVIDGLAEAFEAYKATNDERLAAVQSGNSSLADELNAKLTGIEKDVSALSENTRNETATPTLREVTPTHGELYAYPKASEWSLDDTFFNIEHWLSGEVVEAIAEANAVISGDGPTSQPAC